MLFPICPNSLDSGVAPQGWTFGNLGFHRAQRIHVPCTVICTVSQRWGLHTPIHTHISFAPPDVTIIITLYTMGNHTPCMANCFTCDLVCLPLSLLFFIIVVISVTIRQDGQAFLCGDFGSGLAGCHRNRACNH